MSGWGQWRLTGRLLRPGLLSMVLFGLLPTNVSAGPYSWELNAPSVIVAPSDRVGTSIEGASIQGALVDIRYGQVSIGRSGTAEVLDLDSNSVLTLNGKASSEKELLAHIAAGLSVFVRYNPDSGKIGWLDGISNSPPQRAAAISLDPYKGPAYQSGDRIRLSISRAELQRIGFKNPRFFLPGLTHSLPTTQTRTGAHATLRIYPGIDFVDLRVFVIEGDRSFRGKQLSISTTPPSIDSYGPVVGSAHLPYLSGWVDHHSDAKLLETQSGRFQSSPGSRIIETQITPWRSSFKLEFDGPGTYWIDFEVFDKLGRRSSQRWPISIRQ